MNRPANRRAFLWLALFAFFDFAILPALTTMPERRHRAEAQEAWTGPTLLNTNGVKLSNGATPVSLIATPSATYRVYLGGVSLVNRDSITRTCSLVSSVSLRVMWSQDIPSGGGILLDSTQLLAADAGEGVSFVADAAGVTTAVRATATGYAR